MDTRTFDQRVRLHIYTYFIEREQPPTAAETAASLAVPLVEVEAAYQRLNHNHTILLDGGQIRMANPLSAVPTPFRVHVNGRSLWANCAWDALGIAAMLHSDATIETQCADSQQPIGLRVENDRVTGAAAVVHFAMPFKQWYDDEIFT